MKISSKETLRKLFSDYVLYLKLFIISSNKENEFILIRLKETNDEISYYIKKKLKIKIENYLNLFLDTLIIFIRDKDKDKEKEQEFKDKLFNISKDISQLLSSKKLLFIYKNSIKILFKSLRFRLDSNYKKDIEYYDSFFNNHIKIADIIFKLIDKNKNNNTKIKGGCKLLGEIKCRCNTNKN